MEIEQNEWNQSSCGSCIRRYDPRRDLDEFCTMLSLVSMSLGLILLSIGYVVPREYEFDPYAPARQMEATELYYAELSHALDICIVVGMGFVGAGGIIITAIMMHGICCGHLRTREDQTQLVQSKSTCKTVQYYGSADAAGQSPSLSQATEQWEQSRDSPKTPSK